MNYLIIRTISVLLTSYVTKVGVVIALTFQTGFTALLVAIVLAIINTVIKPIIHLVSIPITLITLGLFSFVINGFMIMLASYIVPGFEVPSLLMAIYFSIVLSIINWVLHIFE